MKKYLVIFVVLAALTMIAGCKTYDLTTNRVGWSSYADIAVKDYTIMGIITLESQLSHTYSPFGLRKSYTGSNILWSDLMAQAARMGADDIINVRIEQINQGTRIPRALEFITGYTITWKYRATALAIKYEESIDGQRSVRADNLRGQEN